MKDSKVRPEGERERGARMNHSVSNVTRVERQCYFSVIERIL